MTASAPPPFDRARWSAAVRVGTGPAYAAERTPDRPAIVAASGDRTYAELDANANRLVRALRRRGLRPGDAVAILCSNRAEFAETWAACTRSGFRMTPVNWHLSPEEADYIVRDCQARAFVADATRATAVPEVPQVDVRLAVGGELPGFELWDAVLTTEDGSAIGDPSLGAAMLYTSGTTGHPKGVHKTPDPEGYLANVSVYRYRDGDVHLCTGPLYHAAPYAIALVAPLTCGVPVVLMARWEPEETLALIAEHRVTHCHMVPTMFHRLLSLPAEVRRRHDLSSLKSIVHGAAPCPVETKRAMIEWVGPVLHEYYSATEGYGTVVDSTTWLARPGTVGRADPERLYVGDQEADRLPPGVEGLVWLKAAGPARFAYFGDDQKTADAYRGDFFTLGDVGHVDADGFLFLTDRSANLIISGGVNIYPAEVDAVLLQHPAVADVAVIGIPDDEWGEAVHAVVELRSGTTASEAELIDFCRERIAHYKCPRRVDLTDHLPRGDNGKLYKRRLREQYRTRGGA